MDEDYWFADVTDEQGPTDGRWQPFLQNGGSCLPLAIFFLTKEACEDFISYIPAGKEKLQPIRLVALNTPDVDW